jgi:hypothetical protein
MPTIASDALGGEIVLAAGEAVGEQRERGRRADRPVDQRRQFVTGGCGKLEAFGAHGLLPSLSI